MGFLDDIKNTSDSRIQSINNAREESSTNPTNPGNGNTLPSIDNPYAVPSANLDNGGGNFATSISNFNFLPNVLSQYQQPAYWWKFYVSSDDAAELHTLSSSVEEHLSTLSKSRSVILAETGATSINIKDVSITQMVAHNPNNRQTVTVKMQMTLVEPYGLTFLDQLFTASQRLLHQNYTKAPCFWLQLAFHGYMPDDVPEAGLYNANIVGQFGNDATGNTGTSEKAGIWIWNVNILDIAIEYTSTGGKYVLTLQQAVDTAQEDRFSRIQMTETVAAETLGEATDKLAQILTQTDKEVNGGRSNNEFFIEFKDTKTKGSPRNWRIVSPEQAKNPSTSQGMEAENQNKQQLQFGKGKDIPFLLINTIATRTIECGELAKQSDGTEPTAEPDRIFSSVFIIRTKTEVISYNPLTKDYDRRFTWYVYPYETYLPVVSSEHAEKSKDPEWTRKIVSRMAQQEIIKKRYDYLFTGQNTEVLRCDFNFNLKWAAIMPTSYGYQHSQDRSISSAVFDASRMTNRDQLVRQQEAAIKQLMDIKEIIQQKTSAQQEINDLLQQQVQLQDVIATLAVSIKEREPDYLKQLALVEEDRKRKIGLLVSQETYAELLEKVNVGDVLPIAIRPASSISAANVNEGLEGDRSPLRSTIGAILNQLYEGASTVMSSIKMEIRGDPYWLGPCSIEGEYYSTDRSKYLAQYHLGDNVFLLVHRVPAGVSDEPGTEGDPILKRSDIITALYTATTVTHNFADGLFTTSIEGKRIPTQQVQGLTELIAKQSDAAGVIPESRTDIAFPR